MKTKTLGAGRHRHPNIATTRVCCTHPRRRASDKGTESLTDEHILEGGHAGVAGLTDTLGVPRSERSWKQRAEATARAAVKPPAYTAVMLPYNAGKREQGGGG